MSLCDCSIQHSGKQHKTNRENVPAPPLPVAVSHVSENKLSSSSVHYQSPPRLQIVPDQQPVVLQVPPVANILPRQTTKKILPMLQPRPFPSMVRPRLNIGKSSSLYRPIYNKNIELDNSQKQRAHFTDSMRLVMSEYYKNHCLGEVGHKRFSKSIVLKLSKELGLTKVQVKQWVRNRNKRERAKLNIPSHETNRTPSFVDVHSASRHKSVLNTDFLFNFVFKLSIMLELFCCLLLKNI